MMHFLKEVLAAWPYWAPVLTFLIGISFGRFSQQEESRGQLCRLTAQIDIPSQWRKGVVCVPLDGKALDKPAMSKAGLLIRSSPAVHGSGVCISSDGVILTNAHVVGEETVVEVEDSKGSYLGKVIKRCTKRDVALIRVSSRTCIIAEVAPDLPAVGDDLYVSGTPWSTENKSMLTRGVVSKLASHEDLPYIFTDAAMAPGNSGGPVFNSLGKLVGLTVAVQLTPDYGFSHIGLVIPIQEALKAMQIESRTAADRGLSAKPEKEAACSR
jgi:S1-C subfamily serine protease